MLNFAGLTHIGRAGPYRTLSGSVPLAARFAPPTGAKWTAEAAEAIQRSSYPSQTAANLGYTTRKYYLWGDAEAAILAAGGKVCQLPTCACREVETEDATMLDAAVVRDEIKVEYPPRYR